MHLYYVIYPSYTTLVIQSGLTAEELTQKLQTSTGIRHTSGTIYNSKGYSHLYKITSTDLTPMLLDDVLIP